MYKFARNLMIIYYYINLIVHLIKFTFQPYLINQSMIFFAFCTFAGLNITFIRSLFFFLEIMALQENCTKRSCIRKFCKKFIQKKTIETII